MTIKEIAKLANTSRGTVDRVIHHRGKVNKALEERIWQIIQECNYSPNENGRILALNGKKRKIVILLGKESNPYFNLAKRGIISSSQKNSIYNLELIFKEVDIYNQNQVLETICDIKNENPEGMIISCLADEKIERELNEMQIPLVALSLDLNIASKVSFVGCDYDNSGALLGNLINLMLPSYSRIGIIAGSLKHKGQAQRLNSLKRVLNKNIKIYDMAENFDNDDESYKLTRELINNNNLDLLCFVGAGINGGLKAVNELQKKIKVITVDQSLDSERGLKYGLIQAVIAQHPYSQGLKALNVLIDYLYKHIDVKKEYLMENSIYLKESIISHTLDK